MTAPDTDLGAFAARHHLTEGFRPYLLLTLLCLALFVPGLASLPPMDRDEARFMQATKQMIETITALDKEMTILMVEHDMDLVFSVCERVTVLAEGAILAEGEAEHVADDERVQEAYLGVPL